MQLFHVGADRFDELDASTAERAAGGFVRIASARREFEAGVGLVLYFRRKRYLGSHSRP